MEMAALNVPMVDEENGESMAPPAKKLRFCDEINRVAEIVLVLSALGRIRGGKNPTELELELMEEARSKLVDMCQEFTPKDIIRKDDVKAVIEDLGLNSKHKDQSLGFRAPKLTISEKLSLGKRKMEEAKKYITPTVSNGVSSGFANNVSVAHQWPSGEVNTTGSHFRMVRPPQMMVNGASQGTTTSSPNYYAAPWSPQPQSTISFSTVPDKKVPVQSSARAADRSFRPFMSQTPHGTFPSTNKPMQQGMHYGQTSLFGNNHNEIAKIVHKVLQPLVKQYALWNPPSRDYMSSATACQMCEVSINEVETLLVCDACEKAYHLKCLQANNMMKGVPNSEWYCSRCVQAYNGKPFPPKYGPTITTTAAKRPSSTVGAQSSTVKKVGSMDIKVNQQKPIVTMSPGVQNFPGFVSGAATTSANTTATAAKTANTGPQGFKESVICGTNSPAPVSLAVTPNPTAIASTGAVINNGLTSETLILVGTMSSTSPLPVGNQVPVNATLNASPSTPISASLEAQAQAFTENGDSSSTASGTTDRTTPGHALTVTSNSNSQPAASHSETAKATEGAAIGEALNTDDGPQSPMGNNARCEKPSESTSHSDSHSLNDQTTLENGQEFSKDASKKFASETFQNHSTASPAAFISDQDSKITAEPSVPQENSAYQTEKTRSQPPSMPSNYHSQSEKETPNVKEFLQNVPGDSHEGEGVNGLDGRHKEQPSETDFDKSASTKEANAP